MLVTKEVEMNNGLYIETRSDAGLRMKCGDRWVDAAIDPIDDVREYIETDIPIGEPIPDETAAYAEAGRILMGVEE